MFANISVSIRDAAAAGPDGNINLFVTQVQDAPTIAAANPNLPGITEDETWNAGVQV